MANRFARFVEPAQAAPVANRFARFAQDAAQEPPTLRANASGSAGVEAPKSAWIDETMGQYTRDRAGIAKLEEEAKAAGVPLGRAVKWKRSQLERQDREGALQPPVTAALSLADANEGSVNERAAIIRAAEQIQSSPLATWPNTGSKTSIPGEGDDTELTSALDVLENYRKRVSPEVPGPQFMRQMFPRGTAQKVAPDPNGSWTAAGESMLQGIRQSVAGRAQALGEKSRYSGNYVPAIRGLLDAPANLLRTEGYEQGAEALGRMGELGAQMAPEPTGSVYDDPAGWLRYYGQQGVASSGQTLTGMAAGFANPVLGAAEFLSGSAGSEYGKARIEDNATPSEAGVRGLVAAATEGIPELVGSAAMLGRLPFMKLAESTARGRAAIALPVEAGTEMATEKANIEIERSRGKYISPEEESKRMRDAGVIGSLMGGTIGAGSATVESGGSGLLETIRQANSAADISSPMAAAFTRAAQQTTARILSPTASPDAAAGAQIADDAFRAAGVGTVAASDIAEQDALARDLDAAQREQLGSESEIDRLLTGRIGAGDGSLRDEPGNAGPNSIIRQPNEGNADVLAIRGGSGIQGDQASGPGYAGAGDGNSGTDRGQFGPDNSGRDGRETGARELGDGTVFLPGNPAEIRQRLTDASERGVQAVHAAKDRDSYVSAVHSFGKSAASGTTVTDADTGIVYVIKKSRNEKTGAEHVTFEVADGKGQNDFTFTTKADGTVTVTGEVSFPRAGSASVTPPQGMAREMDGVQGVRFGRNAWPEVMGVVGEQGMGVGSESGRIPPIRSSGADAAIGLSGGTAGDAISAVGPEQVLSGNRDNERAANLTQPTQAAVAVDGYGLDLDSGRAAVLPSAGLGRGMGNVEGPARPTNAGSEAGAVGSVPPMESGAPAPPALRDLTDDERNFWPALTTEIRTSIDNPGGRMIVNNDGTVGRTKWADLGPMSGFWRDRPTASWTSDVVLTALDRASKGEKLSVQQKNIVEYAKGWARDYAAEHKAQMLVHEQESRDAQREDVRSDIESTLASVADTSPQQRASTQSLGGDYTAKLLQYKKDRRAWGLNPQQEQEYQDLLELDRETGKVGGRPMVGVRNKTAYVDALDAGELLPVQGFTDADDFKSLNDKLGHAAGDDAIREIGDALVAEFGEGNVFHRSGDEFLFQGADQAEVDAKMQRVRDRLSGITLQAEDASGNLREQQGIEISYGTGADEASADAALVADKQRRKESGKRVGERRATDRRGVGSEPAGGGLRAGEDQGVAEGVGDELRNPDVERLGTGDAGAKSDSRSDERPRDSGRDVRSIESARTEQAEPGLTVAEFNAELAKAYDPRFPSRLARISIIAPTWRDVPQKYQDEVKADGADIRLVAGFVASDGTIVLIPGNMQRGEGVGVTIHEVGVHAWMAKNPAFRELLSDFKAARSRIPAVEAAFRRAESVADRDKNGNLTAAAKATLDEEAFAYYVEQNWNVKSPLMTRIKDAIARLLNRLGIPTSGITDALMRQALDGMVQAARESADAATRGVVTARGGKIVYARDLLGEAPSETTQLVAQWKAKVDAKLRGDGRAYVKPSEGPGGLFGGPAEETADLFAKPQQRAQGALFSRKRDNSTAAEDRALDRGDIEEAMRIGKRRIADQREALGDISNGVILKMDGRDSWAIVMPDVEGGGKWRMQMFDRRGFVGHRTRNSRDAALDEALQDKYTTRDDGALDEIQDSPEFVRGNFIAGEMMQLNAGKITSAEFDKRIADYDSSIKVVAKYSRKADGGSDDVRFFDDDGEYETVQDVLDGLSSGALLVHARVPDGTDFKYGIDPSAGEFLRSTESWQYAEDQFGEGPELTFFAEDLAWAKSEILKTVRGGGDLELVFVRKAKDIQKSLGDGRVQLHDGKVVPYERSPIADYESDNFKDEPAGVESGDWYTNKSQDVVAAGPAKAFIGSAAPKYSRNTKTITINGTERPTTDSTGKAIHPTEEGVSNFWRWFAGSKITDAKGRPIAVHHGTNATTFTPGTTKAGSASARSELERMAVAHGIKEWDSVAGIFSRWLDMGMADEQGVTKQVAEHARELHRQAKSSEESKSRVDLAFDAFNLPDGENELGSHFGTEPQATQRGTPFPFYLSITNPIRLPDLGTWNYQSVMRELRKRGVKISEAEYDAVFNARDNNAALRDLMLSKGIDGVVYENEAEGSGDSYIALKREQIKSTNNSGTFSPTDARIAYSRKTPAEARMESAQKQAALGAQLMVSPGQSFVYVDQFTDDWRGQALKMRERIQDKLLSVRNVQQDIEKIRGAIQDAMNVYRRENLMHGRVGDQRDKLQDTHVKPLIEAMAEAKVSPSLLEDYLEARHAKERNEKIAATKGGMPDGASGMTTAQAEDFLQGRAAGHRSGVTLDPAMTRQVSRLARKVYAVTAETRRRLLDSGQITQEAFDALENAYAAYVPLRGKDGTEGGKGRGTGKGIDVRGKPIQRAAGRGEGNRAQNILAEVIADAERSIMNAEKLRVGRTLARLVLENPNPDVWEIEPVRTELKVSDGTPEEIYESVKNLDQEEGTIIVKVKGKPYRIVFADNPGGKRMADAMKNMAVETVPKVIQYVAGLNRYFSAVLTRYNPSFVGVNMTRDLLFGMTGIWAEHGTGAALTAAKSYFPAMRAAWRDIQGKPPVNAMGRYAREFAEAGGKTYFGKLENVEDLSQRIGQEFKTFRQMAMPKALGGESSPIRALAKVARDSKMVQAIEAVNDTVENTLRLSVYAARREAGASIEQAAEYAKNISVNFNRRGSATSWLNALYLFFNAATQGAHRTLTLLKNPKVQGVLGGLAALQAASAMFLMGLDDEDGEPLWDSISPWDKQRNLIFAIPIKRENGWGATVIKIPMPYGFNLFPYMGGRSVELARDLQEKPVGRAIADYTTDAVVGVAQAMSPIPFDDGWKAALPHWVRIFTVLSENKDDLGIPIRAGDQYDSFDKPRSASGRDDTPRPFKIAATALNRLGGGDDYTPPYMKFALDWAPEDLSYLFKTFAGGLGSNVVKSGTLTEKLVAGVPINFKDVPMLSSFVSNVDQRQATSTRYYDHKDDIEREIARQRDIAKESGEVGDNPMGIKIARNKSGAKVKRGEGYELEGKPGSLFDTYKQSEKDISRIRDEMRAAFNDQSIGYNERIRKIDELKAEREEVQRELNAAWREQRKKQTR